MNLPKPDAVNFSGMTIKEQNKYYARHVRGLITFILQQDDFPDKFRGALETIDDYTFYLCDEIGTGFMEEDNFCEDKGCDGVCDCGDGTVTIEPWEEQEPLEDDE